MFFWKTETSPWFSISMWFLSTNYANQQKKTNILQKFCYGFVPQWLNLYQLKPPCFLKTRSG
jgi:hypothetical protein